MAWPTGFRIADSSLMRESVGRDRRDWAELSGNVPTAPAGQARHVLRDAHQHEPPANRTARRPGNQGLQPRVQQAPRPFGAFRLPDHGTGLKRRPGAARCAPSPPAPWSIPCAWRDGSRRRADCGCARHPFTLTSRWNQPTASTLILRWTTAILILATGFTDKPIAPRSSDPIPAKSTSRPVLLRGLKAKMRIAGWTRLILALTSQLRYV